VNLAAARLDLGIRSSFPEMGNELSGLRALRPTACGSKEAPCGADFEARLKVTP
jgi:hypothetical protein